MHDAIVGLMPRIQKSKFSSIFLPYNFSDLNNFIITSKELDLQGVGIMDVEPLLSVSFEDLVLFLKKLKLRIVLETNRTLPDEKLALLLKNEEANLCISLGGVTELIYDRIKKAIFVWQ